MSKPTTNKTARRGSRSLDRMVRREAAARVWAMESEKAYLQKLHGELGRQWRSIGGRIEFLDMEIEAEKASVRNDKATP